VAPPTPTSSGAQRHTRWRVWPTGSSPDTGHGRQGRPVPRRPTRSAPARHDSAYYARSVHHRRMLRRALPRRLAATGAPDDLRLARRHPQHHRLWRRHSAARSHRPALMCSSRGKRCSARRKHGQTQHDGGRLPLRWQQACSAGLLTTRIRARHNVFGRTSLTGRHKSAPAWRCC
jgi:hypothetical protein